MTDITRNSSQPPVKSGLTRRPGFALEREFYTSPEIFEQDIERIYLRHWLFAGHVSRLPRSGDFFLYCLADESVIIVREQEEIHALQNVCRHRGSRICREAEGTVRSFVCPYHRWTYRLDGSLLSARHMENGFCKEDYSLRRCQVRVVEGLIFICLSQDPPPFDEVALDIEVLYRPHGWKKAQICARVQQLIPANWKILAENFYECYHCAPTHPELTAVMSYVSADESPRLADELAQYTQEWEKRTCQLGYPVDSVRRPSGVQQHGGRIPIRRGFLTQSRQGQPVAPLMGSYTEYDGGVTSLMFFPVHWFTACNDHGMLARFTPLSPRETEVELTWLVHPEAVEGVDYEVEHVTWLWLKTVEEDLHICANNQAGVNSRYYQPGPYSKMEGTADRFMEWYLKELAQE